MDFILPISEQERVVKSLKTDYSRCMSSFKEGQLCASEFRKRGSRLCTEIMSLIESRYFTDDSTISSLGTLFTNLQLELHKTVAIQQDNSLVAA